MKTQGVGLPVSLVVILSWAVAQEIKPVAVSPGSERGVARVSERCPTFSWSAVGWAAGYRVAVFETKTAEVKTFESQALASVPALTQEIKGKALSWTPSTAEQLKDGGMYVWYVQARDATGNGLWSAGKKFLVEAERTPIIGVEERVAKTLRTRDGSTDVIAELSKELRGRTPSGAIAKGFTLKSSNQTSVGLPLAGGGLGAVRSQGNEGDAQYNTYYGYGAGYFLGVDASNNSFFGYGAGNHTTSGDFNTFVGTVAGLANTTSSYNTFIGAGAGNCNTTGENNTFLGVAGGGNTTGYNNTFVGAGAGNVNSTGYHNTFLGAGAGNVNTAGFYNTFLGYGAGQSNTSGISNTHVGHLAGYSNTGSCGTLLGYESGYSNTTGINNTSVGYRAGRSNQTGSYNTMVGYQAGYSNTASSNTFLGSFSGYATTTGTYNTFFGQNAGRYNTTGSNNVFLGLNSCYNNTTGGNNVVIGVNAGFKIAGTGNVILGYRAGFNETGSNKLYIDNYSDTFPLIYGDFGASKVGINGYLGVGVQNSSYRIQVAGGAYCNGTTWTNASSRSLKENIRALTAEDAQEALSQLAPVRFNYKADATEECLGFIAEDVPPLVATGDRKGLSPMDIVAVLTKVVQEQQKIIEGQQRTNKEQQKRIDAQQRMIDGILTEIGSLKKK